jgi:hypothetical protein
MVSNPSTSTVMNKTPKSSSINTFYLIANKSSHATLSILPSTHSNKNNYDNSYVTTALNPPPTQPNSIATPNKHIFVPIANSNTTPWSYKSNTTESKSSTNPKNSDNVPATPMKNYNSTAMNAQMHSAPSAKSQVTTHQAKWANIFSWN